MEGSLQGKLTSSAHDKINQLGMEEEIVFFLLQTVVPRHQLQSAFMHNSIRGWVYLETTMNNDLIRHLRLSLV